MNPAKIRQHPAMYHFRILPDAILPVRCRVLPD